MKPEEKKTLLVILLIFGFFLGLSLFINLPALQGNFLFADEAIYYSLTQSLAQDYDLEYTKKDLIRYYEAFDAGPLGIFLKKGKQGKLFFAKSFAYPLFAAPFVRLFGCNGFLVFHSFLLLLLLLMGWAYLSPANGNPISLVTTLTFIFASVAGVYFYWISPDFFNLSLTFSVLFLWLFKHRANASEDRESPGMAFRVFLYSDWSDYLAALLAGIAAFAKPPNIVLIGPLVFHSLVKRRFIKTLLICAIFLGTAGAFFGVNQLITGDWNYQGGQRKTFYGEGGYPLEKDTITFDSARGGLMSSERYTEKHLLPPKFILFNFFYYFFGRFTGVAWYFFPAFLAIVLFFFKRKRFEQWLVFAAICGGILIYVVLMPDNYAGGGGALANRYFLSIYPLFLFLPAVKRSIKENILCWAVAALFLAPILTNPILHSHYPATHAKKSPFTLLPVEMTLVNNFPTNTNPNARRQPVGMKYSWLYFLDDNYIPRQEESELEQSGFWTRGPHAAEMILKTYYPIKSLTVHLLNNPRMRNAITVKVGRESRKISLGKKQRGVLTFTSLKPFCIKALHLYKIKIKASKGSIPYFEDKRSMEKRYLGVFFEFTIEPEYMPEY
ncbi:MAG: hypothetical protein JXB23_04495 [Candidatus Aminicenantes bacterium]|nr:hypothetical protein [Candidatus Aminicenantes bacterium]